MGRYSLGAVNIPELYVNSLNILCVHLATIYSRDIRASVMWQCKMSFYLSLLAFVINFSFNWYVYVHYYEGSPLPPNLNDWWYTLSVWGAGVSISFMILDCCCCCCDVREKFIQEAMASASFVATVLLDLSLLLLSLISIYKISDDQLCKGSEDVLCFFQLRSVVSLIASFFHLIKVCMLNCDDFGCLLGFYISHSLLSIIVCGYASFVC